MIKISKTLMYKKGSTQRDIKSLLYLLAKNIKGYLAYKQA